MWSVFSLPFICSLMACGNSGKINFHQSDSTDDNNQYIYRNASFNLVSASQALMIESGKNTTTGYHAKVQLNEQKGTKLTGGGYTARIKYTTRTQ